ncbi:hypothetical protein RRSWK_05799 [Rhodopirellula sp. SWK7]|nr:hypothetical protein RRSWK_05799 [Rhodopirellula sp. SWK7]
MNVLLLSVAVVAVAVFVVVLLIPPKPKRVVEVDSMAVPMRSVSHRRQQIEEESTAIAMEYERRANEVWMAEVTAKAVDLLWDGEGSS